jgi:hypothetical protein
LSSISGSDFGKATNQYLQGQVKNWWESSNTPSFGTQLNSFFQGTSGSGD